MLVDKYIKYVTEQIQIHKLQQRLQDIEENLKLNKMNLSDAKVTNLNDIDKQFTEILQSGEQLCSRKTLQHQPWSPQLQQIGRTFSYWKQILNMANKKNQLGTIRTIT
jgi:hypothetical protein